MQVPVFYEPTLARMRYMYWDTCMRYMYEWKCLGCVASSLSSASGTLQLCRKRICPGQDILEQCCLFGAGIACKWSARSDFCSLFLHFFLSVLATSSIDWLQIFSWMFFEPAATDDWEEQSLWSARVTAGLCVAANCFCDYLSFLFTKACRPPVVYTGPFWKH